MLTNVWKKLGYLMMAAAMLAPLAAQSTGSLKVKAHPGRAGVFLDGKYLGPAANLMRARKYEVPAGDHELILREPRYQDSKQTVKIEPGKTTNVEVKMERKPEPQPPFGTLRIVGFDKYAAVYLNGSYMGHADEFNARRQGLLLNPGSYDLRVVSVNGTTLHEEKVTVTENEKTTVKAK